MGIVNAKLLSDNLKRINDLHQTGLSNETIASAARDKTKDRSIQPEHVEGFRKLGNIGCEQMLVSAKQARKLDQFVKESKEDARRAVEAARTRSEKISSHSK